ncbi:MAG TPA: hypothetical protein VMW52_10915 [Phycisphaerae bacterium]|nr:hypothetical protein [Phycisphaerae bacterium]
MDWKKFRSWLLSFVVTSAVALNVWTTAQVYEMRARGAVLERDVLSNQTAVVAQDRDKRELQCAISAMAVDVAFIRGQMEGR